MSSTPIARHYFFFFFNDTATTEIYTLSLHDALPISTNEDLPLRASLAYTLGFYKATFENFGAWVDRSFFQNQPTAGDEDRKSTRLNSSHANISYAVFCLKKKKNNKHIYSLTISYTIL